MKYSTLVFLTIIGTVTLASCAAKATPTPALIPITVQLAWTHQAQFAGMYAADQMGYYAAEGLALTFIPGGPLIDKLTPVLNGTALFGIAGADELILARSEGKPLRAIATIFRRSPIVFASLAEKGITQPQDFIGQKIDATAIVVPTLHAMMAHMGITPDQYMIVDVPTDLEVFASGDISIWGLYINGSLIKFQQAGYKLNLVYPDDYGVHFYADTIFTTDNLIATDPGLVLRFLRATLKGWTYAVENPDEIPAMLQKYKPDVDLAMENTKMLVSLPLINTGEDNIGWMKPEIFAGMDKILRELDLLTAELDVTQVYTLQFVEEIYDK